MPNGDVVARAVGQTASGAGYPVQSVASKHSNHAVKNVSARPRVLHFIGGAQKSLPTAMDTATAAAAPLSLKVRMSGTDGQPDIVRRFAFTGERTFASMLDDCTAAFGVSRDIPLHVTYFDDEGDEVTMSSTQELHEAIALMCDSTGSTLFKCNLKVIERSTEDTNAQRAGSVLSRASLKSMKEQQKKEMRESKLRWKEERQALKAQRTCEREQLRARFVRLMDGLTVDAKERLVVEPLTPFSFGWKMRNEGRCAWPKDTSISKCKGGDLMGVTPGFSRTLELEELASPGETRDIEVELVSPMAPGEYQSHWKLAGPSGKKFGHRVTVSILVVDPSERE